MDMIRKEQDLWDPFNMITDLQSEMNRAFNRSLTRRDSLDRKFLPDIELTEETDQYLVRADLPGLRREDFSISVEGNHLTLKGERKFEKETKEKGCYYSERQYGHFARTLELPLEIQADKVKATFKDGVLEIILPKAEHQKPKQINVEVK